MSGSGRSFVALALAGVLLLVIGALTVGYVAVDLPAEIARRIEGGATASAREIATQIAAAFQVQPKVVVGHRTVVEQRSDVLKLVTVEETLTERQRLDESWLHSTKTLEIEADFVIRAGFDLAQPFVIEVDSGTGAVRVMLPPAEILSTELADVRFVHEEDGLWNRLTPADREAAIRDLRLRVGLRARESDLLVRARTSAEKRLRDLLARGGRTITFSPALPAGDGTKK